MTLTRADCEALDAAPQANAHLAARFAPGPPGTLYFDANSIGPMPAAAPGRVAALLDQGWRVARRRSWSQADWLRMPMRLGAALAPVLGVGAADVLVCDSTSINQFKLLRLALAIAAPRRVIVVQREVFPSNRHIAEGIAQAGDAVLRDIASLDDLDAALAPGDVAVVALSLVDWRHSERLPLRAATARAQRQGALLLCDASHAAGAMALELGADNVDFALGCGYKYLCGGPGAPAWLYVHPRWQAHPAWPAMAGWMGHADTFAFGADYVPAPGVARHQVGTPAVIANEVFAAAAEIWAEVDCAALSARHAALGQTLVRLADEQLAALGVSVASPRAAAQRGGHVALRAEGIDIEALGQALVAEGVVVSTRRPDSLRLAPHPLTTSHADCWAAVQRLKGVIESGRWREPQFQGRAI